MTKPQENGWSETYRVKFPLTVDEVIKRTARLETRTVPEQIVYLVKECLARRERERLLQEFGRLKADYRESVDLDHIIQCIQHGGKVK